MLGAFITLSGVRRPGRRVVYQKKTNLRTVDSVNGLRMGSIQDRTERQDRRGRIVEDCRRRVANACEVWHKTIKSVSNAKGFRGTPLTAPVTAR